MAPRKGSTTKASAKTASVIGTDHALNNNAPRGATSTRGGKRKRTSNNENYSSTAETVIATNPFDDDNNIHNQHNHHNQLNHNQYHYQQTHQHPHQQTHPQHHQPPHPQPPQQQQLHQHQYHQSTNMNHPAQHQHMGQHQHSVHHENLQHQQAPIMHHRQGPNNHDPNGMMQPQQHPQHHMQQHQFGQGPVHPQQQHHMGPPPGAQQMNPHNQNQMHHHQQQHTPQQPTTNIQNLPSHHSLPHQQPVQNMYAPQQHISNQVPNSASPKMMLQQPPNQHIQHQHPQVPHQIHSGYANPEYMHHSQVTQQNPQGPPPPPHATQQQQPQMSIQQQPITQSHPHNMSTPPTQMVPAGQGPIITPDHIQMGHMTGGMNINGPSQVSPRTHHQQITMHNQTGQIMTAPNGPVASQANVFGPPQPQPQLQQQHQMTQATSHLPHNQMIGTPTPPQMMNSFPAPPQSPYMKQQGPPIPPPHGHIHNDPMAQTMTPQAPLNQPNHMATTNDQMLIHPQHQEQSYGVNQGLYCVKCQGLIYQQEPHIVCKARCNGGYHRLCSGLTESACNLLMREPRAQWVCDRCSSLNTVPLVKHIT